MQEPASAARSSRPATSWLLAQLAGPPRHGRGRSIAIVAGAIAAIGWVDYLTGIRVSLELFYLVPITLSVAWLGPRTGCVVAIICILTRVGGDLANGPYNYPLVVFWNRLTDLAIYWVLAWVIHGLISLSRELDRRVRERTRALEQAIASRDELQHQLFEISRRERSAIGHDLHDGLGQHLTATAMAAEVLSERLRARGDAGADDARAIVRLVEDGIAKTRHIARGLLLSAIEPDQLPVELEELAATVTRAQRVPCRFVADDVLRAVDTATASHLFYIAREAVHNALRHARPTRLELRLAADATALTLSVTDDGRGLPSPDSPKSGMGLRIMAHRAELIGAEFSLGAAPDGGTIMRCRVPTPQLPAPITVVANPPP